MKWPNHYPCPFLTYIDTVWVAINFLLRQKDHVVSIHCLAGKGRTGSLVCGVLYVSGRFKNISECVDYYLHKRAVTVDRPSQLRYLDYFVRFLDKGIDCISVIPKALRKVIVSTADKEFFENNSLRLCFEDFADDN